MNAQLQATGPYSASCGAQFMEYVVGKGDGLKVEVRIRLGGNILRREVVLESGLTDI